MQSSHRRRRAIFGKVRHTSQHVELFLLDPLKNLFAMHRHILGRIDPEPDLIAFDRLS
jgi:hypothetical protein